MSWFPLHLSIFSLDMDFQFDSSFIIVLNVVPLPSEPRFWWEIQSLKLIFPYRGKKKRFQAFFPCLTMLCLGMDLYEFILLEVWPLLEPLGFYCLQFEEVFSLFFFFFEYFFIPSLLFPGLQTWMWSLLRASQDPEALFNFFPVYFPSVVHTKFYCSISRFTDSFLCPQNYDVEPTNYYYDYFGYFIFQF